MTTQANNPLVGGALAAQTHISVGDYLQWLDGETAGNVYRQVMDEVGRPLLEIMMRHSGGNQTLCAELMGINRATLRTKLKRYNLI